MAIETNQVVSIEYEVRADGSVVDSNVGGQPLVFMFGKGQVIPGLETGLKDMSVGEKGDLLIKAEDAYGKYNPEATQDVSKEQFAGIDLQQGMTLYGQGEDGSTVQVVVKEIKDETVIVDFNHPMAGQDLMFSVTVNSVRDASADEIASGIPAENQSSDSGCCSSDSGHSCGCH